MDEKVTAYIEKQPSLQKGICESLRALIFETLPEVKEEMKWGVPTYNDDAFYVVSLKDHVNLGFAVVFLPADEAAMLSGGGKTMKVLELKSADEIDKERIKRLLELIF